jgi:glycine/D-amino acid oxidase-like deaminating enzyme
VDVAVIGGGVMGASAAYWLTRMQPGLSVTVYERDPSYAQAATALSAASIRQQFSTAVNVRISRFGIEFLKEFTDWLGPAAGDPGLRENGYLFLATTEDGAAVLRRAQAVQVAEGAATVLLDRAGLAARFPWVETGDITLGSFGPEREGWFDNMGLLWGFRRAAQAQGARFVTAEVAGLEHAGGRVTGVTLADGSRAACGTAVMAAGTRAAGLLRAMGEDIPVEPRKRTVFVVDAPEARFPQAPLLIDPAGYWARPDGRHWLCATVPEHDPACALDDFDPSHGDFEEAIWPLLYARMPAFETAKVLRAWAGHYDYNTFDQNALAGPMPGWQNLLLLNGFSGHGLQQSPAMGRGIAEQILTGGWQSLDLSDLDPGRVAAGRPVVEEAVV